jgi:hypothetical protein
VRARADESGGTVVDLGGLPRSDAAGGFEEEFAGLAAEISGLHQGRRDDDHNPSDLGPAGAGPADPGLPDPGLSDLGPPDGE